MCKQKDYDECEYVANFCGNWHEKEIIKQEWVKNPVICNGFYSPASDRISFIF